MTGLETGSHLRRVHFLGLSRRLLLLPTLVFACLILNAVGADAQTADDHGNTFGTATPLSLGSSITGRIDPGNDVDVFKLDLTGRSGNTDVWVYTTGELDTKGGLYLPSSVTPVLWNENSFITGRRLNFHLRATLAPGTYYVGVFSFDRLTTGDYVLHSEAVTDPGNSISTAKPLNLSDPTAGTIDFAGNVDYIRLNLSKDTHLFLYVRSVYGQSVVGYPVDTSDRFVPSNTHIRRNGFYVRDFFGPGTHYIKIFTLSNLTPHPVPYTIHAFEESSYLDFLTDCQAATSALNDAQISDSLYGCQWHLRNQTGEDINVEPVWADGIKGEGVNVAVVDDGMDFSHIDLRDNVSTSLNHNYADTESIFNPFTHHGTQVTGVVSARDNGVGVRGVAPRATVYGYNYLVSERTDAQRSDAMTRNAAATAVSNNSWGHVEGPGLGKASLFWERSVDFGVNSGYGGKGTFYTWASGNGHMLGDDGNLDELANYYGVTAVCSVNDGDLRASYSEFGANLWVCAPSGDLSLAENRKIVTTENYDRYVYDFNGTSAATPIISGVAALMRQANPSLTWRDLKLILAASARKNDPTNAGWKEGARKYGSSSAAERYHFNHEYGFGVVDAKAAVDLARGWTNVPPFENETVASGNLDLSIPDAPILGSPTTVTHSITLSTGVNFTEFVEVNVSLRHISFRDVEIELKSPSGAVSKLAVPFDTFADDDPDTGLIILLGEFRFGSARHLGEDPNGTWELSVADKIPVVGGTLDSWSIKVYGHRGTQVDTGQCGAGTAVPNPSNNSGLVSDCETLLEARDTLVGTGTSLNWAASTPMTSWDGVTVGGMPTHVTELSLENKGLRGTVPAQLGNLSELRAIRLSTTREVCQGDVCRETLEHERNQLTGPIPTTLGDLSRLQTLTIGRNQLSGPIPTELGNLTNLTLLAFGGNQLSGTVPTWLGNLNSLEGLFLWGNGFTGSIPTELTPLTNLTWLELGRNQLSGSIPVGIGNLINLERLTLHSNQLTGSIPTQLGSLSDLKVLSLWGNQLSGTIPASLTSLLNLEGLYLRDNQLTGCIPSALRAVAENDLDQLAVPYCDVLLSGLVIDPGALTPAFDPYQTDYTAVASASTVTVTPSSLHAATFEFLDVDDIVLVDADASMAGHQITLAAQGVTVVKLKVTSQDGAATNTYTIRISMVGASEATAVRSFSAPAVAPGSQLVVTIEASDYGSFGGVVETLPGGFGYVSSNLPTESVMVTGQSVQFTLFGENSFTYTATATTTEGFYTFSGILKDSNGIDSRVGGTSAVVVGDAPGVSVSRTAAGALANVRFNSPIPLTATFSESVSGFTVGDITVTHGSASNFVGDNGDSVYTFDVTPDAVGSVTVDIDADVVQDTDGKGNYAAMQLVLGLPYDDDQDGRISRDEVVTAIGDFLFSGALTRDQVVAIIALFLFG